MSGGEKIIFNKLIAVCFVGLIVLSIISGTYAACKSTSTAKDINLNLNEEFKIELGSNPSTGYGWYPSYDSNFIKLISSYYIPSSDNCGSPGTNIFLFKAAKTGETNIIFKYQRLWDPNPEEVIIHHINVNP